MFTIILNGTILVGLVLLILTAASKMLKKAAIKDKVADLQVVSENYEEVLKAKAIYKNSEKKENEINKFTKS